MPTTALTPAAAGEVTSIGTAYTLLATIDVSGARAYGIQIKNTDGANNITGIQIRESLDGAVYSSWDLGATSHVTGAAGSAALSNFSLAQATGGEDSSSATLAAGEVGVITVPANVAQSIKVYCKFNTASDNTVTINWRLIPWDANV